jgi:hypothetical protein
MKAIVHTEYGPPDVLEFEEVATPMPADDEVSQGFTVTFTGWTHEDVVLSCEDKPDGLGSSERSS